MRYEEQYHKNRAMVIIGIYVVQMGVNKQITWLNQCVQHMIRVEEVWDIGDRF